MEYNVKILNRLKRSDGQLHGVLKMIEERKECVDIVTQLSAVRSSLDRAISLIVAENLKDCFENPQKDIQEQSEKIDQAIKMIIKK